MSRLFRIEGRLRERIDRAGMRMEDADPVDLALARTGVRLLNLVDRVTGFRGSHRLALPQGQRLPPPPPGVAEPWLGQLDRSALDARRRARLKEGYRRWERIHQDAGSATDRSDPGGHLPPDLRAQALAAWAEWQRELGTELAP